MLKIEEFAARMQVSRATAFEWLTKGILIQGRHYIRIGRVVRIPWSEDLIGKLLDDCFLSPSENAAPNEDIKHPVQNPGNGSAINWDYKQ